MVFELLAWILAHWLDILTIWAYVVAVASLIVKLTPTVRDDHYLKVILRFTGRYLALNRTITPEEQEAVNRLE
jgi:hypothetical protein